MKRAILNLVSGGILLAASLTLVANVAPPMNTTHAANTLPGSNEIISINTTDGLPANASLGTYGWRYSGDGNVIAFYSTATNLPGATSSGGLYTYNIKTDTTSRIDVSTSGVAANNGSGWYEVSEDGRYVSFISLATNLIDGQTTQTYASYRRDLRTGTTIQIASGHYDNYGSNPDFNLGLSNDGRFSLISSRYLSNGYPNAYGISYIDKAAGGGGSTYLGNMNNQGVDDMTVGQMSCDGSFVVYQKYDNIYLADMRKGNVLTTAIGHSVSSYPIISCNGRYILYVTLNRTDITPTPSGLDSKYHLVRYDRITGERQYIDSNSSGVFSNGYGTNGGGSYAAITNRAHASIADSGDVVFWYNDKSYLKHLSDGSGTLEKLAKTPSGSYLDTDDGFITRDGKYVFFSADPYNLGLATSPSTPQIIRAKTGL